MSRLRRRSLLLLGLSLPAALLAGASPRLLRRLWSASFARRAPGAARLRATDHGAAGAGWRRQPRLVPLDRDRIGPGEELAG